MPDTPTIELRQLIPGDGTLAEGIRREAALRAEFIDRHPEDPAMTQLDDGNSVRITHGGHPLTIREALGELKILSIGE